MKTLILFTAHSSVSSDNELEHLEKQERNICISHLIMQMGEAQRK